MVDIVVVDLIMSFVFFFIFLEYQDKFEEIIVVDIRLDEQIVEILCYYVFIIFEKNVWVYWDSGIDNVLFFFKQNICNWVCKLGLDWMV